MWEAVLACGLALASCGQNATEGADLSGGPTVGPTSSTAGTTIGSTAATSACAPFEQLQKVERAIAAREAESPMMLSYAELLEFQRQVIAPLTALAADGPDEIRPAVQRLLDDVERQIASQSAGPDEQMAALEAAGSPESIAAYQAMARYAQDECGVALGGA